MRKAILGLMATALLGLSACKGQNDSPKAEVSANEEETVEATAGELGAEEVVDDAQLMNDGKHTVEFITQRLNDIYSKQQYKPYSEEDEYAHEPNYDSLFCSEDYLKLYKRAEDISMLTGNIFIDMDHWIMGQDIGPEWSYKIASIDTIMPREATVRMLINNFETVEVKLQMVFERGNWYVDNFITDLSEETPYNEKDILRQFVDDEE